MCFRGIHFFNRGLKRVGYLFEAGVLWKLDIGDMEKGYNYFVNGIVNAHSRLIF